MYKVIVFIIIVLITSLAAAFATQEINRAHLEGGIECFDCHETVEPEKRPAQRICVECHGDKSDDSAVFTLTDGEGHITTSSLHMSHAGQIRCTLCHAVHKPSVLYCNDGCHHTWQIKVP